MYTQCPDCEIAFKVTAEVLKQAAGMVRCGGCGNAFNSLKYLSEQMPKQPIRKESDAELPELKPEIIETGGGLPKAISAEQSAALLKTLDELAGSDIRIEDTGVEWRVLDEEEAAAPAADDDDANLDPQLETVDEYLDDNPTPIDEFLTATPDIIDSPEIFEEDSGASRTSVDELRFDDNTPLPDDFDLDDESSYLPEPVTESHVHEEPVADDQPDEEPPPDVALSEPDEWTDILDEFQDLASEVAAPVNLSMDDDFVGDATEQDVLADELDAVDDELSTTDNSGNLPLDMDSQFALQAEAMGIDLSGINELDDLDKLEDDSDDALEADEESFDESVEETAEESPDEPELDDLMAQLELIDDDENEDLDEVLIEEPIIESHTIENELAAIGDDLRDDATPPGEDTSEESSSEHYIPPMTEEEHTVNMQIDQDLMALAIEDEDGFASTIIIPEKDAESMALDEAASEDAEPEDESDTAPGFETIIMEGEFVRSALDSEKLAADAAAAAQLAAAGWNNKGQQDKSSGGMRYGMIGGVIVLALVLGLQIIHQSREALATMPAFSNTISTVYRTLGRPVQPAWDITGWRFEATKGSTEGDDEKLTVYSRLGNKSDGALPYPLIGISLTDRFEETIGSRMLDPADYLPTDLDPRKLVEPGNTFNAVITIDSATENATGFKLDVCYRMSGEQLRCAIDSFK
jgi:predicted Zn finger-like uncharacterized protein